MPVAVTRAKVHSRIDIRRVLAQLLIDDAHRLDEFPPVERSQHAQAADAVAHRDLVRSLVARFRLHQLLDRQVPLRQPMLDPRQRQRDRRALPLQPARHLGHERADQRRIGARHVGHHEDHVLGNLHHLVRPRLGQPAVDRRCGDPRGDTAQVFDQRKAQHDWNRPQFAEFQRCHQLVCRHEAAQALRIDATVAVCNRLERDVVDARQPGGRSAREARQLLAVAFRQMPGGHPDLVLDQIKIVEQPFTGRRDPSVLLDGFGQQLGRRDQDRVVLCEPGQQLVGDALGRELVRSSERLAVLLHLVGAEQFSTQRQLFFLALACPSAKNAVTGPEKIFEHGAVAEFHACLSLA